MNIFQRFAEKNFNLKITYQFSIILLLFVVSLALMALVSQFALHLAENTQKNAGKQTTISSTLTSIEFETLTAILYEKSFRRSSQRAIRAEFKRSLHNARKELDILKSFFTQVSDQELITRFNNALFHYEKFFSTLAFSEIESYPIKINTLTDTLTLELATLLTLNIDLDLQIKSKFEQDYSRIQLFCWLTISLTFLLVITVLGGTVINGIIKPIAQLQTVINRIASGDLEARINTNCNNELGHLANTFDSLFDERVTLLTKTEYDHQQLNISIAALLRAVSILSQKDLTLKVPVANDMTGAVSDAINLLVQEIGQTLKGVADISFRVNTTAEKVKQQATKVMTYADNQREEIETTLSKLNTVVNTMIKIAKFAKITDTESEKTMISTESAVVAVSETVTSINSIRDIVRETEKRIKRLGERSQEITGVVNIINNIAERTHVLSLNAGMQAASAGEAGKGFMVVANEVQQLAESSGEATEKIASLVKNIQVDTSDTIKTMNTVITQVVESIQQAETAGIRMKESRVSTESLVTAVKRISVATIAQLTTGKSLKAHAETIQLSTLKTNEQLLQQNQLSDDLLKNAQELLVKVNVFKLPVA
jgi:methyl-accepting chemotaxis protein